MSAVLDTEPAQRTAVLEWMPVAAGLLILYVPTFYELSTTLWVLDDYAHGPILLAVIVWLIWNRRAALFAARVASAPVAGFTALAFGLFLYVVGRSQGFTILEIGSLAPILAGVLLVMRGWPALRAYWFMLLFLVFLVPVPSTFVDSLTGPLKHSVSSIAEQILYGAGYPIARDGVMLTIGQYQLLVADACSGLNSMFSLSALGLLYLYLMHYKSWVHNGVILLSLLPIAFCANIVRVLTLLLVTYHLGDAAGQGLLHQFSGILLFVISLILILLLDTILVKTIENRRPA